MSSTPTPIESLAALRDHARGEAKYAPATTAAGGMLITMFFALPLGAWLGTDAGLFGGIFGGLGWWMLLGIGLIVITSIFDEAAALGTIAAAGLLAAAGWFLLWADEGVALPLTLSLIGPAGGLLAWRGEVGRRAELRAQRPLGLGQETIDACLALPDELAEPLRVLLDRAIADVHALSRFVDNGMLAASGESTTALRGDVDRAVQTMARRALVADTMLRRGDDATAAGVIEGIRQIGDDLDAVTDAALEAAASIEAGPAALAEHVENLRLTTASQGEIARAVGAG